MRSSQDAGRLRRLAARSGGALGDGLRDAGELLEAGRPALVLGAVGYMALDAAALWAAFQALGGTPDGATFMLAYVLGQLGGLIPLPGGLGGTDGGLIGAGGRLRALARDGRVRPERRRVASGAPWESLAGYSRALRVGTSIAVAGTAAADPADGAVAGDEAAEQTREAIRCIAGALAQLKATRSA